MVDSWAQNGKVLDQVNGAKHLFFTAECAAVVASDGTLVTTIPASWYDAGYLELVRIIFGG